MIYFDQLCQGNTFMFKTCFDFIANFHNLLPFDGAERWVRRQALGLSGDSALTSPLAWWSLTRGASQKIREARSPNHY